MVEVANKIFLKVCDSCIVFKGTYFELRHLYDAQELDVCRLGFTAAAHAWAMRHRTERGLPHETSRDIRTRGKNGHGRT